MASELLSEKRMVEKFSCRHQHFPTNCRHFHQRGCELFSSDTSGFSPIGLVGIFFYCLWCNKARCESQKQSSTDGIFYQQRCTFQSGKSLSDYFFAVQAHGQTWQFSNLRVNKFCCLVASSTWGTIFTRPSHSLCITETAHLLFKAENYYRHLFHVWTILCSRRARRNKHTSAVQYRMIYLSHFLRKQLSIGCQSKIWRIKHTNKVEIGLGT